ncbi:zinc finger MYM-type protein 1-like [Papaver somniferum]|uniref:zinc finger MYM-type protein 1-like n=1 Tax=Papaver somniferum TaxID=3469 RepID=UPI000E6F63C3|nr:zinc finger MYM-type protein 1-like [Papaver somniferum]
MVTSLRKEKSGHEKVLKKRKELALKESQIGALNRFLVKIEPIIVPHSIENENVVTSLDHNEIGNDPNLIDNDREEVANIVVKMKRFMIVKKGQLRDKNIRKGPNSKGSRYFSSTYYTRALPNGEEHDRKWLVYSKEMDKAFCFCCKLFKNDSRTCALSNEGFNDWIHFSRTLSKHENCKVHNVNMRLWLELRERLELNDTIDRKLQRQISEDKEHWKQVLKRFISVVKYLSIHNLAFRGTNEKVYENSNRNFLGLIEMIAEWDPVMKEHMRRIKNNEIQYTYLSSKIQTELIDLLASKIKSVIIQKIKAAKESPIKIQEYFMGFLKVVDTTAQGLFDVLKSVLEDLDLDINNIRGQGYDNGANMSG